MSEFVRITRVVACADVDSSCSSKFDETNAELQNNFREIQKLEVRSPIIVIIVGFSFKTDKGTGVLSISYIRVEGQPAVHSASL